MNSKVTVMPAATQELHPGEDVDLPFDIKRENCDDSVLIRLDNLPPGVRMTEQCRIHRGETSATCRLHAETGARLVPDQEIRVIASAPGIPNALQRVHLAVKPPEKGVGPKGEEEAGRGKYWNEESEKPGSDTTKKLRREQEPQEGEDPGDAPYSC